MWAVARCTNEAAETTAAAAAEKRDIVLCSVGGCRWVSVGAMSAFTLLARVMSMKNKFYSSGTNFKFYVPKHERSAEYTEKLDSSPDQKSSRSKHCALTKNA